MQIDLPATLTAQYYSWDENFDRIEGPGRVEVSFGSVVVGNLPAVREPRVHYDSGMDEREEQAVVEDTVAAWLREKLI